MRPLIGFVHLYPVFLELNRVDHESNTIQKLSFSCFFQNIIIKLLLIALGNHIPCFGRPAVAIIDGVEPKILNMPAKSGELHSHINPRNSDPTDLLVILFGDFEDGGRRFVDIVEVPIVARIVEVFITKFRRFELRKTGTKLM